MFGVALAHAYGSLVSRHWRSCAEPGWIEAFGQAVAIGWIVIITASVTLLFLVFSLS